MSLHDNMTANQIWVRTARPDYSVSHSLSIFMGPVKRDFLRVSNHLDRYWPGRPASAGRKNVLISRLYCRAIFHTLIKCRRCTRKALHFLLFFLLARFIATLQLLMLLFRRSICNSINNLACTISNWKRYEKLWVKFSLLDWLCQMWYTMLYAIIINTTRHFLSRFQ